MPIYEYRCGKCGEFEVMQRMSDAALRTCPTCRRKVTKLISSTSFQLKGSGWYITDYARKGETKKPESGSDTTTESKSDAKTTDTPSESKSETKSTSDGDSGKSGSKKSKKNTKAAA